MFYHKERRFLYAVLAFGLLFFSGCDKLLPTRFSKKQAPQKEIIKLQVHSTAYTSCLKKRYAKYPKGAWGDALTPTCKSIAVSDDLLKMGLTYQTKVRIEGLEGEYTVMDKMHPKWKKKIDVYMGNDFKKARYWGVRNVMISWEKDTTKDKKKENAD